MWNDPISALRIVTRLHTGLTSGDGKYTIPSIVALSVSDADADGVFVTTDTFSTTYGAGESIAKSVQNYIANLFVDFEELEEDEDSLGPALREELASLRRFIVRK
jgi:cell shape-determining protein MreC